MKSITQEKLSYRRFYDKIHQWLKYHGNKKGICLHCGLKKKTQYALKKGETYTKDFNAFIELCVSCHRRYDITEKELDRIRKIGLSHKGKPATWLRKQFICSIPECGRPHRANGLCSFHNVKSWRKNRKAKELINIL